MDDILHAFGRSYWSGLKEQLPGAAEAFAFVALASLVYAVFWYRKPGVKRTFREILRDTFPRDLYLHPTQRVDRWNFLLALGFGQPMQGALTAFIPITLGPYIASVLVAHFGVQPLWLKADWANIALQTIVITVGASFFDWYLHYLQHKLPVLWAIHRSHHTAERLTFFTSGRGHPTEFVTIGVIVGCGGALATGLVCYLSGAPLLKASAYFTVAWAWFGLVFHVFLAHTHIPLSFGRFNAVFGASVVHQVHHSAEERHRDRNFSGGFTMFWDVIFGTYYNPHIGLREFYLEPCRLFWRTLTRSR